MRQAFFMHVTRHRRRLVEMRNETSFEATLEATIMDACFLYSRLIHHSSRVPIKLAGRIHIFPWDAITCRTSVVNEDRNNHFYDSSRCLRVWFKTKTRWTSSAYFRQKFKANLIFVRRPAINRSQVRSRSCADILWAFSKIRQSSLR
jgi:hypothetical protein